jgi:hypothetical protein
MNQPTVLVYKYEWNPNIFVLFIRIEERNSTQMNQDLCLVSGTFLAYNLEGFFNHKNLVWLAAVLKRKQSLVPVKIH